MKMESISSNTKYKYLVFFFRFFYYTSFVLKNCKWPRFKQKKMCTYTSLDANLVELILRTK